MGFFGNNTTSGGPEKQRGSRLFRCLAELLFVLAAAFAGVSAAWPVLHLCEEAPPLGLASYFGMFNASAMIGTGHGFVLGSEDALPELKAFLHGEKRQLTLPEADTTSALISRFTEPFVLSHCYLVLSLGWWWRLMGVSMHSFMLFVALLYAVTAAVLYGLFRLGCGRIMSLLGALCVATSPLWLDMATSLRDFAKAPFVLAFLLLAVWAVLRRFSGRGLLAWALATGILLGFGWGFRQDLLACFLPALLLPWVVQVAGHGAWRWRAASCLLLLTSIAVVGSPVISAMRANNGAVSVHTLMQGFSERSESAMSFGDASYVQHMDWGDPSAHAVAAAYAVREGDIPPMGMFHSPSYVVAARRYIAETMRTFPADFFRRGLASAFSIPGAAADACRANNTPPPGTSPWIPWWARIHRPLAEHVETFGVLYVLLALAVGFAVNFRASVLLAMLGVYIGAYPSLLFQTRHAFHLSFVPFWAMLWLLVVAGRTLARRACLGFGGYRIPWRPVVRASAGILAFLALLAVTGWCLDRLQTRSVDRVLERYRAASLEPVPFREVPHKDGWVLVEPLKPVPGLGPEASVAPFEAAQALLALQLDWAPPVFPVRMVYEGGFVVDFTQDVYPLVKDLSKKTPLTCFLPVLELNWPASANVGRYGEGKAERGRFVGIAVPESRRDRVRGLFRVANAAQFPLHLFITVPDDRSQFIADKLSPWTKRWELCRAKWGGRPDETVSGLCRAALRYPYDGRIRHALEALLEAHHDPFVWSQAWPVLASLNPDRCAEAGLVLDRFSEECSAAGDLQAAVGLYRTAIHVAPDAQWHKLNLGKTYERLGRKTDALAQYLEVLAREPESAELANHVDQMYDEEKDPTGRLAAWQALCGQHPSAFVPAHHLALAYAASGNVERALSEHERAFNISPEHAAQLMDYGRTLLDAGQWQRAAEMFRKAAAGDRTLAPSGADHCVKAADDRLKAGDAQNAIWLYRQAIELRPDDHWLRIETATALKTAGDLQGALAALAAAITQAPDEYAALQMDQLLESGATPEERVSRWRALATEHAECIECLVHLGMALEKAGKTEEAQREYEAALQADVNRQPARVRLGTIMAAHGREAEGLALVDQAVAADPSIAYSGAQAFADAAARKAGDGDMARAEELYRRAVSLAPNDGWHRVHLGEVLAGAGKPDEGAEQFLSLLRERPESPYCASQLDALLVKYRPEKRLETWKVLSAAHPDAAIPQFYLGKSLESLERWDDAAAAYQASFKINPGLQDAWIARAVLEVSGGNAEEGIKELLSMSQVPGLPKEGVIAALDDAARRLREKGEMHAALGAYSKGLTVFHDAPPLLFGQSEALEQAGDRAGAMDACVRLLTVAPESPKTAGRLDTLCKSAGPDSQPCTELWKGIVQAHPDAAVPQLHLGLALEALGDMAGAEAAYRQALSRDPKVEVESTLFNKIRNAGSGVQ